MNQLAKPWVGKTYLFVDEWHSKIASSDFFGEKYYLEDKWQKIKFSLFKTFSFQDRNLYVSCHHFISFFIERRNKEQCTVKI